MLPRTAATSAGSSVTSTEAEEEPCSVLRIEDEYDILRASSQRPTAQRQVSDERGQFDVHTLEDGGEVLDAEDDDEHHGAGGQHRGDQGEVRADPAAAHDHGADDRPQPHDEGGDGHEAGGAGGQ